MPPALIDDMAIRSFLGTIVRICLCEKINTHNNPNRLTITPIEWDACKIKFVVQPGKKVVCGSPRDSLSYVGLRLEDLEYVKGFTDYWNSLYLTHKGQTVVESCQRLLKDYLERNHVNNFDQTVLWEKIHEVSREWSLRCKEYGRRIENNLLEEITCERIIKAQIRKMVRAV